MRIMRIMRIKTPILWTTLMLTAVAIAGCGPAEVADDAEPAREAVTKIVPARAETKLKPTQGNDVTGTVTFESIAGGIRVIAHVNGLTPGIHGFHIHETGDCSAPDATSAGGHFNPAGHPHGAPDATEMKRHVGDLGNLTAGDDGHASYERIDPVIRLDGEHSIVGKAVIVHAEADDLKSQPTGAAGARVACGIIESAG